jgi:hypothetical protein
MSQYLSQDRSHGPSAPPLMPFMKEMRLAGRSSCFFYDRLTRPHRHCNLSLLHGGDSMGMDCSWILPSGSSASARPAISGTRLAFVMDRSVNKKRATRRGERVALGSAGRDCGESWRGKPSPGFAPRPDPERLRVGSTGVSSNHSGSEIADRGVRTSCRGISLLVTQPRGCCFRLSGQVIRSYGKRRAKLSSSSAVVDSTSSWDSSCARGAASGKDPAAGEVL